MNDFYILLAQFFSTCLLQCRFGPDAFIYNSELGMRVYYLN